MLDTKMLKIVRNPKGSNDLVWSKFFYLPYLKNGLAIF